MFEYTPANMAELRLERATEHLDDPARHKERRVCTGCPCGLSERDRELLLYLERGLTFAEAHEAYRYGCDTGYDRSTGKVVYPRPEEE